jgi:hydroxymethylglutaryl-CoA lyase
MSIPVDVKVALIERLAEAGMSTIEAGSFVNPQWVPQMAGSDEVFHAISRREGVRYTALTPNLVGLERAIDCGVNEVAILAPLLRRSRKRISTAALQRACNGLKKSCSVLSRRV